MFTRVHGPYKIVRIPGIILVERFDLGGLCIYCYSITYTHGSYTTVVKILGLCIYCYSIMYTHGSYTTVVKILGLCI